MNVITLTLCPAFDLHCHTAHLVPGREHAVRPTGSYAAGKGINISRALLALDHPCTSVVVLGEENADAYLSALGNALPAPIALRVPGRIRENLTVHADDGTETRISFPGFCAAPSLLAGVWDVIFDQLTPDTVLTLTGRLPDGIGMQAVQAFLAGTKARGVRTVIDSGSFSLTDLCEARPWLIKPNAGELSKYLGQEVCGVADAAGAARKLHRDGIAYAMISLGERGALMTSDCGTYLATPPAIVPLSTVGAGDSTIAGFLAAKARGASDAQSLALAVATGTAACLTNGTLPPHARDIDALLERVTLTKL